MAAKRTTAKRVPKKTGPIQVGERIRFVFEENNGNYEMVQGTATFMGLDGCGVVLTDVEYDERPSRELLVNFNDVDYWDAQRV